ncbi:cysteine desulfurase family protein [Variibacter gotjawalensis]|nr:cysteine desulfurase family protein [Variibacter gotjawalensis]NIK46684.1 cysteine desulfurase [Variibacter gotjawalensis]
MTSRTYLDWNATAPLRPESRAAMVEALDRGGNASSLHAEGRAARSIVENARRGIAQLVGAETKNLTFTSGGSEANALALSPGWGADVLLVSAIEHPSVLAGGQFAKADNLPVDVNGSLSLTGLQVALEHVSRRGKRAMVSLMLANNEVGTIQPVKAVAELVYAAGGLLHVDAVQAAGRIPIDINDLGVDLLTLSAHKIGGPQGIGALIRRSDKLHLARPLMRGGGQERGLRAGTENIAAIAGFGAAAAAVRVNLSSEAAMMRALQERLEDSLCNAVEGAVVFGSGVPRLPNTTLVSVPGTKADTLLIALDLEGMAVSAGSACSSGKIAPSHVLAAMGVASELALGAIRVSTGYATEEKDVDRFLIAWRKCVTTLLKRQQVAA